MISSGRSNSLFMALFMALFSTSVVTPTAWSAEWKTIEGSYAVTAQGYIDPGEDEPKDTHYRLQLNGASAQDLYTAMKVQPIVDECTGGQAKEIGHMKCLFFQDNATYECAFSINILKQTIEYGVAC